ncbi:MAG: 4a-hydroxytetrahydrobiopterin dehydratase [Anaerolineaceae bacterium]
MSELIQQNCVPVRSSTPALTELEISELSQMLSGWNLEKKDSELRLVKVFKFTNFNQAISFSNQVARIADEQDHHPALLVEWGKVTVNWWTHVIHGLHLNDFIMAAKTDQLFTSHTS